MKREKLFSCLWSSLLGTLLSLSGVACLTTGFDLMGEDMIVVTAVCFCIVSFAFSLCYVLGAGWMAPCALLLFTLGMLLWGELFDSIAAVVNTVTFFYDKAYGWGVVVMEEASSGADATTAMCYLGAVIAFLIARSVCRGKSVIPAVAASLVPLAACLVVTDKLPDILWIYLLLLGIMLLVMTGPVRRQSRQQGNRLLVLLLLPAALVLNLLFGAIPQETYDKQEIASRIADSVLEWLEEVGLYAPGVDNRDMTDLTHNLHFTETDLQVMTVMSTESDLLYLRGRSLDVYNGTSWTYSNRRSELFWPVDYMLIPGGQVRIRTFQTEDTLYLPYYVGALRSDRNTERNSSGLREHTYYYDVLPENVWEYALEPMEREGYVTQLPKQTRQWAEPLARALIEGKTTAYEQALAIVNYVQASAEYDLSTDAMPEDKTDFAQWFLYESDTGYCVHYATAAAVLLRAVGIPARYVTGYMVKTVAGDEMTVRTRDAHAWVEVYIEGVGWMPLDPTPNENRPPEPSPTTRPTTETTTQPTTQPTTRPTTQPTTEPTEPETTQPTTEPGADPNEDPGPDLTALWQILKWLLLIALIVGTVLGQRILRLRLRQKRLRRGSSNRQAIARWRYGVYLDRLLHQKPSMELYELAQKAKFSQHRINKEELSGLDSHIHDCETLLRQKPLHHKLLYTLILAIY